MAVPSLKQWRNGEVFNARDYVYERNIIIAEINRLEGLFTGNSDINVTSITMGGRTINNFSQLGNNSYLNGDEPTGNDINEGDLWFDTTP